MAVFHVNNAMMNDILRQTIKRHEKPQFQFSQEENNNSDRLSSFVLYFFEPRLWSLSYEMTHLVHFQGSTLDIASECLFL